MSLTYSSMLDLDSTLIEFDLYNAITNINFTSNALDKTKPSLIMFICNHCPFVVHVLDEIISISEEYFQNISFIAISSNDIVNYPEDSPKLMKKLAIDKQFTFPYLYDENQEVAKKYDAACTPDFFLYDKNKKLVYRGQLDDSRPGNNIPVTGKDLRNAIVSLIEGKEIDKNQKPSIGCNIKWI